MYLLTPYSAMQIHLHHIAMYAARCHNCASHRRNQIVRTNPDFLPPACRRQMHLRVVLLEAFPAHYQNAEGSNIRRLSSYDNTLVFQGTHKDFALVLQKKEALFLA